MENNSGRPKKYTDEEILSILEDYVDKHLGKSIGYAALERETGVPQHIFKYRAKEFIQKYKEAETTIQEIKETYEVEIEKLKAKIQKLEKVNEKLNDTLSRVFIDSENLNKRRTQGVKENIIELTPENMEKYKKMIDDLTL